MPGKVIKIDVDNPFKNSPVYYIKETSSTMVLARKMLVESMKNSEAVSGKVIIAGFQISGRGRIPGRVWDSNPDENLTFTLILHKSETGSGNFPLSLTVGLGLAFYMESKHLLIPQIKWPNDILIGDKKISGIIVENIKNYYLIGVGINCNQTVFSEELNTKVTSLRKESGQSFDLKDELSAVLDGIHNSLRIQGKKAEIEKRLYRRGKEVVFLSGDPSKKVRFKGVLSGIGTDGTMMLQNPDGNMVSAVSGEIIF